MSRCDCWGGRNIFQRFYDVGIDGLAVWLRSINVHEAELQPLSASVKGASNSLSPVPGPRRRYLLDFVFFTFLAGEALGFSVFLSPVLPG